MADSLYMHAKAVGRAAFMREFANTLFLIRVAAPRLSMEPDVDSFSFRTRIGTSGPDTRMRWTEVAAPVTKRAGNPFPDRISVGRAQNCDVVIRLPYVSKLHAHFIRVEGNLQLADNGSSQGTTVNGKKLEPGEQRPVKRGDTIRFGYQDVELGDAARAWDALMDSGS